jgi:hypothetical protein
MYVYGSRAIGINAHSKFKYSAGQKLYRGWVYGYMVTPRYTRHGQLLLLLHCYFS